MAFSGIINAWLKNQAKNSVYFFSSFPYNREIADSIVVDCITIFFESNVALDHDGIKSSYYNFEPSKKSTIDFFIAYA